MGLPLAWKKGQLFLEHEVHVWIGVLFYLTKEGIAVMELPPSS